MSARPRVPRWLLLLVAAAVLTSGCAAGQSSPTTPPPPLQERLGARVDAWRARGTYPAVSVAVREPGTEPLEVVDGTATLDGRQPVTAATQFRIASITKLLVATVVLQLIEEGEIHLDTSVSDILPQYPFPSAVTVRQLLNHTSGLPDYGVEAFVQTIVENRDRFWEPDDVLATVADVREDFVPGTDWRYSNTNYVVLAEVIEATTGQRWFEQLRARVLDPLELEDTYVAGHEKPRGSGLVSAAYFDSDNDGVVEDVEDGAWPALESSEGAAGAMVSTAADVARFTEAVFTGELLASETVATMVSGGPFARRYDDYGLGVELRRPDLTTQVWGHGGFLPGYRSVTWFVPGTQTTITVLTNHSLANPADLAQLLMTELEMIRRCAQLRAATPARADNTRRCHSRLRH